MTVLAYQQSAKSAANYNTKPESTSQDSSKTAKLSQKIMFQLANGTIDISKNALHFMLYSINFVAKDGRIYLTFENIKSALNFQIKTLVRVIAELEGLGLLSQQDNFYYSHFHVLSNGKKTDETYVRNLNIFTSPAVLNLKKNELRLFLYIATRGIINNAVKRSAVETLYSNTTHKGVNYIDSYLSLATILNVLISNDLIEVHIGNQIFKQSNMATFMDTFHAYCGYQENNRKKRMSKKVENTHVIGFRVNPNLCTKDNVRPNEANRREIEHYADENGFFHSHMRPQTIPTFIKSVLDVLFNRFGLIGAELYREALISYFEKEGDNVIYHDLYADENSSKAINTMVDFFLLPSIKELIVVAASDTSSEDPKVNYFKKEENLLALVDYYIEKGSDNHIVLLEESLELANITLNELVKTVPMFNPTENSWFLLQAQATRIYKIINYSGNVLTANFQKQVVREWAKDGLLSQRNKLNAVVEVLKKKVIFLPKEQYKDAISEMNQLTDSTSKVKKNNDLPISDKLLNLPDNVDLMKVFENLDF